MLENAERQEGIARRSLFAGCVFVAVGSFGLMVNVASAGESMRSDAVGPMRAAQVVSSPITESETSVKVYIDARGRVVREVELHLVIVDESLPYDPESASLGLDSLSATAAQEALDIAFEAAAQGLAGTFDARAEHDTLPSDPSALLATDNILREVTEMSLVPWTDDDDGFVLSERNLTTVPEPGAAVLLAVGSSLIVLRRHRDTAESPTHAASTRVDTAE